MTAYLVGIAGGTASGKTTLTRQLLALAGEERAAVVELDSYYHNQDTRSMAERIAVNYDHPDAFEFNLLAQHLQLLRAGEAINCPVYNFAEHNRSKEQRIRIAARPIVFVEGILTLSIPTICNLFDFKIFVDAPDDLRLSRRLERDVRERGRAPEEVLHRWHSTVHPMYQQFCAPSRTSADLIVDGTSWDDVEVERMWEALVQRHMNQRNPESTIERAR